MTPRTPLSPTADTVQPSADASAPPTDRLAESLPRHIAIIMDGNGRWAKARSLPRVLGHRAGMDAVRRVVKGCCELGVPVLTLYAFSWENWQRPAREIQDLMGLLQEFLQREIEELHRERVRIHVIGRLWELPAPVQRQLREAMTLTAHHRRLQLNLALSYGGRQELVDVARTLATAARDGQLDPAQIDEAMIETHLSTAGCPDPDLFIRTSGELRLSNFLLWQLSYTELYVTEVLWPDFTLADLHAAIAEFQQRERRFGRTTRTD